MIEARCHCGAVRLLVAAPPQTLTDCNCSICVKLGALWAYYTADEVEVRAAEDALQDYQRADAARAHPELKPVLAFVHCKTCGCVTHWRSLDATSQRMGINARMMPETVRAAAQVRRLDGANSWRYLDEPPDSPRPGGAGDDSLRTTS